jgi:hypothetical protein
VFECLIQTNADRKGGIAMGGVEERDERVYAVIPEVSRRSGAGERVLSILPERSTCMAL